VGRRHPVHHTCVVAQHLHRPERAVDLVHGVRDSRTVRDVDNERTGDAPRSSDGRCSRRGIVAAHVNNCDLVPATRELHNDRTADSSSAARHDHGAADGRPVRGGLLLTRHRHGNAPYLGYRPETIRRLMRMVGMKWGPLPTSRPRRHTDGQPWTEETDE
jgi:hypothetical protein